MAEHSTIAAAETAAASIMVSNTAVAEPFDITADTHITLPAAP